MAKAKVSTSRVNCFRGSGWYRTRSLSVMLISFSTAWLCVSVHRKLVPFFRRLVRGHAMWVNPRMKGLW